MNLAYVERRQAVETVAHSLKAHVVGIIGCGSVFHNPAAVTSSSDLDLVYVAPFSDRSFRDKLSLCLLRHSFFLPDDIHVVDFPYRYPSGFIIHNFFWDTSFFPNVISVNVDSRVRRLLPPDCLGLPRSARLYSLRGEEISSLQEHGSSSAGRIVSYKIYEKHRNDFYLGVHANNLLMDPHILYDPFGSVAAGISSFRKQLRSVLACTYGSSSPPAVSLCNTLPKKINSSLSLSMRQMMESFF